MVVELNHQFGNWGEFIFLRRITPVEGTYRKNNLWKFAKNRTLAGRDNLQPLGTDLKTISFSISLKNFAMAKPLITQADRLAGLTGLPVSQTVTREVDYSLYDDIDAITNALIDAADTQEPRGLFVGERYLGQFVLESFSESKTHYRNGESRTAIIDLNFLEYIQEVV